MDFGLAKVVSPKRQAVGIFPCYSGLGHLAWHGKSELQLDSRMDRFSPRKQPLRIIITHCDVGKSDFKQVRIRPDPGPLFGFRHKPLAFARTRSWSFRREAIPLARQASALHET